MEKSNDSYNLETNMASKRVRVKRSMLVEHSDDRNKSKPIQESIDFANDITFTGIEDCDFVNRLRKPDSKVQINPSQANSSPRMSPVPRYTMEDPPSWLAPATLVRQTSEDSGHIELDALGLYPRGKDGTKSVPLSPMQNMDVKNNSQGFQSPLEPSSARVIKNSAEDFEKSLRSDVTFYSPALGASEPDNAPFNSDGSKGEGGTSSSTASKRRQRRSETSSSLTDPKLNHAPLDNNYIPRIVRTANSDGVGSTPPNGTMWGGQPISTAPNEVARRKGSWLDGSPKSIDNHSSPKPLIARTQISPRDLSPLCEPRSVKAESARSVEEAAVAAVESRWRGKFEAAMLEAKNAKALLLEARSKINQQADRILMLEAELARVARQSPQKASQHRDSRSNEEGAKGGVAFDIQVGKHTAPPTDGDPQNRDRLMARLGMSASQRRMLAVVEPDAKLNRILQGDDALPSALPTGHQPIQQGSQHRGSSNEIPSKHNTPPRSNQNITKDQRMVTWQEESGGVGDPSSNVPPDKVPIYRTMSGRYFSDGKATNTKSPPRPRCATCGVSSGLEADEDNPGTYYCVTCWEEYEDDDDEGGTLSRSGSQQLKVNISNHPSKKTGEVPGPPIKSPISFRKAETKSPVIKSPVIPSSRSSPIEIIPKVKSSFAGRCFVLSDNTHLLNQVALLLSKGGQSNPVTALVETKGADKKVRMVAAQVITVGCCHAVGSKGADLGTDVVVARTSASTDSNLIHLDGSRGSMFIELSSMYAFEKTPAETQEEIIGDFKGFRMKTSDGIPLDGRVMDKEWISQTEKTLGITISDTNETADIAWWLSNGSGRIDVILAPQHKGDWYPFVEVGSGRKMAPQFRSSGVGYLRLADDMGSHGNSFISINARTYLAENGFDEPLAASPRPDNNVTPNSNRRRRTDAESNGQPDVLNETRSKIREAKEALTSLRAGCGGAGGSEGEMKWKDKTELLRKASTALEQVCSLVARTSPGGVLPMSGTSANSDALQARNLNSGQEEAVNGINIAKLILGDRGKNVHVLSGALSLLKASGMLCGDRCPVTPTWRVIFPQLLTLFRDSSKVVANAATDTADALHLRCFRIGDASSLGFIIAELQLLGGRTTTAKGGKAPRAVSAVGMVGWLLRALNREHHVWNQGGEGSCIGSQPVASESLAAAILPLLTHREIDTRDLSAQGLASVLLSTEANLSARGQQGGPQGQGHLSLLLPLNASDPKAYAKVVGYLSEGRKRGEHLPTRKTSSSLHCESKPVQSIAASSSHRQQKDVKSVNNESSEMSSLRRLWGQIEYVLRKPVSNASDLDYLGQQAALGSAYLRTLSSTAAKLGLRKGALSRAVLPFDDQTSLADQSNVGNRKTRSLEALELLKSGQIGEAALDSMQVDAVRLRALLRVKIADDADLDQANSALEDIQLFLRKLSGTAFSEGNSPFELLQTL